MNTTTNEMRIERNPGAKARRCKDGEAECVICDKPVKLDGHPFMLWVHGGGAVAVTTEEGERRNANGEEGSDLGMQPIGRDCLRRHPELKPFLMTEEG